MPLVGRKFVRQHQPSIEDLSMNSTKLASIGLAVALATVLLAMPAQTAQVARTFLSAAGSDSNNCANVNAPCRHLATAFAATAADGEIYVLDPANYGSLTITHAVSIEGHGWASIAPVVDGNAITINAGPADKINIIGVTLDGTNLTTTNGIRFNSGGSLTVRDSVIRNFGNGLALVPTASSQLSVSNTLVSDNSSFGIIISADASAVASAVIDNVTMANNAGGLHASSSGGAPINVMVRNSTMAHNSEGLGSQGTSSTVWLTRSTITENGSDFSITGTSVLLSYGDNNIVGNTSTSGTPTLIGYK
jgi:hypothetical protein